MLEIHYNERLKNPYYKVCHCVSSDFALGAGFAASVGRDHRNKLIKIAGKCPESTQVGNYLITQAPKDFIAHLITKEKSWHKPTEQDFTRTLTRFSYEMEAIGLTRWSCPALGCGLDRLDFDFVSSVLIEMPITFEMYIPDVKSI